MTIRHMDSFDDRSTAQIVAKYNGVDASHSILAGSGRYGTACLVATGLNSYLLKSFDDQATWIVGMAIYPIAYTNGNAVCLLIQFEQGGGSIFQIALDQSGHLIARGATDLGTTSRGIPLNAWTYVEVKVTIADVGGEVIVHFDEQEVLNVTGDTKTLGAGFPDAANAMRFFYTNMGTLRIDDMYICDAQGGYNDDFLGDVRVECVLPDGAGGYSEWDPSAGSNYQNVDDAANPGPDGDTTYNSTDVVGEVDSFTFPDLQTADGVVYAVAVNTYDRKTEGGARLLRHVVRKGGTNYVITTQDQAMQDSYRYHTTLFETDPSDASTWDVADVNAGEFGYELEA